MSQLLGSHSFGSAFQRLFALIRGLGIVQTVASLPGTIDGKFLNYFAARAQAPRKTPTNLHSARAMGDVNHAETIASHEAFRKQTEAILRGRACYIFLTGPAASVAK